MKRIFILLIISLIAQASTAQKSELTGKVADAQGNPLAGSVAELLTAGRIPVATSLADTLGEFLFSNLKAGDYQVKISAKGFQDAFSGMIRLADSAKGNTGTITAQAKTQTLQGVVVTSRKPLIEVKADKTILNVDAAISNTGSYALDVLEKAPGVSVDKDGNISLKGKQGVIILIDGKQTYLSGTELANYLRNIPASNLDLIEIMTNPSAKYDASGNAGIINIKTKKQKQKGFNGSANIAYGQGFYPKLNSSLNLNYRVGKVNMFTTLSANTRKNRRLLDINRKYVRQDGSVNAEFDQQSREERESENYNAKVGMDYFISKKTTLGFVVSGYTVPTEKQGHSTSFLKDGNGITDSIVFSRNNEDVTWKHLAANLNLRHQIDSAGQEVTADFDYLTYRSKYIQQFTNESFNPNWVKRNGDELTGDLPSTIEIYTAKIDYTKPLAKALKFESGYKFSKAATDNTAEYYSVVNGVKYADYEKTNRFAYEEFIHAGYVNLNKEWKKWSVQTGLRVESTSYSGHQFGNPMQSDSAFKKSYTSAFPTLYVGYKASPNHNFSASYGRRINRPDYEDLNPFLFFLDKYTYNSGNPYLKPMYSNVGEISHTYKDWLTTTFNYSYTKDLFNQVFEERGYATLLKQGNFGEEHNTSLSLNAMFAVKKWWKGNVYVEGRYRDYTGLIANEIVKRHGGAFLVQSQNNFTFGEGWGAELGGVFRSTAVDGQMEIKSIGQLNIGVQKQVSKKGVIKFNVRDIFLTMAPRGDINFQSTRAHFQQTNDTRVATLSFQYKFGKPIKGVSKRKTGGSTEEQSRVKGTGS